MFVVGLGQETPGGDTEAPHLGIVGAGAEYHRAFHDRVSPAGLGRNPCASGHSFGNLRGVAEAPKVFHRDERTFLGAEESIAARDDAEAVDDQDVGAEICNFIGDVEIQTGDDAHYGNQRGHGQNHTEQGQKTAKLMRSEEPLGFRARKQTYAHRAWETGEVI